MVVIAVAGGLGDLGRQISEAIQATQKHEVIILQRTNSNSTSLTGFKIVEVDYESIESLSRVLDEHEVHTIVSALAVHWKPASNNQLNLIKAAETSQTVKRFIPSEFSGDYSVPHDILPMPGADEFVKNRELLATTNLEYSIILTGMFMDYFGMPNPTTPMRGMYHLIDVPHRRGLLPEDGTSRTVYTMTSDIAIYVAAMLDLPKWEKVYNLVGELTSPAEVVATAERVTGSKFYVTSDSLKDLERGNMTVLESNEELMAAWPDGRTETVKIVALINVGIVKGAMDVSHIGASLNEALPHLRTIKIEEYLKLCFPSS